MTMSFDFAEKRSNCEENAEMIEIKEIAEQGNKPHICNDILRALPDWFGIEEAIVDYVETSREMPFYAAFHGGNVAGFVALKVHNPYTAEVYVMGVHEAFHRMGIGRALIARSEQYCAENGMEFLTVKTLDESRPDKSYEKNATILLINGL